MKFSSKCRTKKLKMIYTILVSFCLFLNWEGPRKVHEENNLDESIMSDRGLNSPPRLHKSDYSSD